MITSLQDQIDCLATEHGRVVVGRPCAITGLIGVTTPNHAEHLVNSDGQIIEERLNHSINWND